MELEEVMRYLLTEGFVIIHNKKPKFTALFQKAYNGIEKGLTQDGKGVIEPNVPGSITAPVIFTQALIPVPANYGLYKYQEWTSMYIGFIAAANVPRRVTNAKGEPYDTSKYSEDGMKAFQKALKEGYDYQLLVKSTMLYYKSGTRFKKTIGNYMSDGDWRTDYQTLAQAAQTGTLKEHLKETITDGTRDRYTWG